MYRLVTENISAEWIKLRFQYLALTPDVIHLLETLRYVEYKIWYFVYVMQKYSWIRPESWNLYFIVSIHLIFLQNIKVKHMLHMSMCKTVSLLFIKLIKCRILLNFFVFYNYATKKLSTQKKSFLESSKTYK